MIIAFYRHEELPMNVKNEIIELKEQSWPYGLNSQEKWMKNNLFNNDMHLLGYSGGYYKLT